MNLAVQTLKEKWIQRTVEKMHVEHKKVSEHQVGSYCECISTVMSSQIRSLLIKSLADYKNLFEDDLGGEYSKGVNFSGFLVRVVLQGTSVHISDDCARLVPSIDTIKSKLLNVVGDMQATVQQLPRATLSNASAASAGEQCLKPAVFAEDLASVQDQLHMVLDEQMKGPEAIVAEYIEKFDALIGGGAASDVQIFLDGNNTFENYSKMIFDLKHLIHELEFERPSEVQSGMFLVSMAKINQDLANHAKALVHRLTDRMVTQSKVKSKELSQRFEQIAAKALEIPMDTHHLMELKEFVETARAVEIPELQKRVDAEMARMNFLLNHTSLEGTDMDSNAEMFTWLMRLDPVFAQHEEIMDAAQNSAEDRLKDRREDFKAKLLAIGGQISQVEQWGDVGETGEYLQYATELLNTLAEAQATIEDINHQEEAFGWPTSDYPEKNQLSAQLDPYLKLYQTAEEFKASMHEWLHGKFEDVSPEAVEEKTQQFWRTLYKSEKELVSPASKQMAEVVKYNVEKFKAHLPLITSLCNPGMRDRHWDAMSEAVGFQLKPDARDDNTLHKYIDMELGSHLEEFQNISEGATKEHKLEKMLESMQVEWKDITFNISPHEGSKTYKFGGMDELQMLLDDHIVKTQTMLGSPNVKPFEGEVHTWSNTLNMLQDIIDNALKVQATWMYLYPIFSSPDIMAQMPEEGRRFTQVDKAWRDIMGQAYADQLATNVIKIDNMLDRLRKGDELLELILKGLNAYLEQKRLYFSRFFFLSNDELLEILSETKDPTRVQPHLKKCFEGIAKLSFTRDLDITQIISSQKEEITLQKAISTAEARGQVEIWLLQLQETMVATIRQVTLDAMDAYPTSKRIDWVQNWPGQVVLSVTMKYWTANTHAAINNGPAALGTYTAACTQDINDVVMLIAWRAA